MFTALREAPVESGRVIHVSAAAGPDGDGSERHPLDSIAEALERAQPGDTVAVGRGTYRTASLKTVRGGRADAPIRIRGRGARIVGEDDGRLVQILHDHVIFQGFDVTGADILVWVFDVTGARILGNHLKDALAECVRLKYFARGNEVAGNRIEGCGRKGFDLDKDDKNGEAVYIGTAPEQLDRNPTDDPDASSGNWIHDNVMSVPAECVDVKEGATGNVVEHNTCTGSRDPEGAGFSSRAESTTFLYNVSTGHVGAGLRLGGDDSDEGMLNHVVGNRLVDNGGYGIKIERYPQGVICENELQGNHAGPMNSDEGLAVPGCNRD